jgi:hypothetical protein
MIPNLFLLLKVAWMLWYDRGTNVACKNDPVAGTPADGDR